MSIPPRVLAGIDHLSPLPVTANRLIAELGRPEVSLSAVATLLEYDQVIAARVLRMARSAAYAGRMPATDIRQAVMRLGAATVLELVMGDYMRTLKVNAPLYALAENELWAHGAAAALAARAIAQECTGADIPPLAHTAALLHDIGKLLMVRTLDADPTAILTLCRDRALTWVEAERELFGCDHAQVGAEMGRRWSFPAEVISAIEQHHDVPVTRPSPLVDAVVAANLAAKSVGVGLGNEGMNLKVDPAVADRLRLDFAGFSRVCAQTAVWLKDLRGQYSAAA